MPIGTPFPSPDHRAVASDVVRYVGEPVAVVVARDRYVARDAADAITVEYDPLPVVVDPEQALTGQPAVLHADFANNAAVGPLPSGTGASTEGRRRHGDRPGVRGGGRRRFAAHGEPPARADLYRAAGRRGPLRAGQGRDDHLVLDPEPAHPAHVHRLAHRPRAGPGAGDRAGGRAAGSARRSTSTARSTSPPRSASASACRSSGWRIARRRSSRPSTGATSSPTSTSRRAATAPCSA